MATATQVKERPIVLDAREVLGVLDGTITQLWRVVKPQPEAAIGYGGHKNDIKWDVCTGLGVRTDDACARYIRANYPNPFGSPGDRLWVREAWRAGKEWNGTAPSQLDPLVCSDIRYEADGITSYGPPEVSVNDGWGKVRQSIHMPRWASRLTLEVADVRVQRVNEISGPWAWCVTFKRLNETAAAAAKE